jgi:hypothetical protein
MSVDSTNVNKVVLTSPPYPVLELLLLLGRSARTTVTILTELYPVLTQTYK